MCFVFLFVLGVIFNVASFVQAEDEFKIDIIDSSTQEMLDIDLAKAAMDGNLPALITAHENGADLNANDGLALIKATTGGDYEMTKYLVENGADRLLLSSSVTSYIISTQDK